MKDCTMGDLEKARQFACETGQLEQFEETLERVIGRENRETICGKQGDTEVRIYSDFTPYSFSWVWHHLKENRNLTVGGMIYHGKHDGGGNGSAPTFSVCLEPTSGWSIHT